MAEVTAEVVEGGCHSGAGGAQGRKKLGETPQHALAIESEYGERQRAPRAP